jgi:hypothetical protein
MPEPLSIVVALLIVAYTILRSAFELHPFLVVPVLTVSEHA